MVGGEYGMKVYICIRKIKLIYILTQLKCTNFNVKKIILRIWRVHSSAKR